MKKLIIRIVGFAVSNALLLLFACEIGLPEPASTPLYKREIIESHLDAETLVLGSSHAAMGIIPRDLRGSAVSLANPSQDLYYDCELARRYIPRMPRLRRVIVEISFFSWEGGVSNGIDAYREVLYYRVFGIPPQHWSWRTGYYSRIACYGFSRAALWLKDPNRFDAVGWLKRVGTLDAASGKVAAARHLSSMRMEEAPRNLERVASVVRDCRSRGIEVVLVTLPSHPSYNSELDVAAWRRMREATRRLCAESGLRHLDYQEDARFAAEDFADGDHLNVAGARKFTPILELELERSAVTAQARP
jgi:hypothetical protein